MPSGVTGVTQAAKVALFVAALAVATVLVYRMVSKGGGGGASYTVTANLRDASGLVPKSRVKIAGIPVGYIDSVTLEGAEAKVSIKMDKGVVLHTNATASKRSSSLLGDQVLVIMPGTAEMPTIPDGGRITNVQDTATTDAIMQDVAIIAEKVKAISVQAAGAFGTEEGGRQMKEILANLADVSKEINETVKENRRSVTESIRNIEKITERSAPKVDRILGNVEAVTGDFRDLLERSPETSKADPNSAVASVRETLDQIKAASKNLDSSLKHADNVLGRIDRGEGTFGRLSKDEALINDVEGVAGDVREFTGSLNRIQTIVGVRSEYYVLSNGLKSYVELRIQPREDKYYLIELINDPRGKTTLSQIDINTTNPNFPPLYRETRTETRNEFRISFMLARRLGPATFLFGIRESSGGVGVNLHALDDRLEFRTDLFGFGENVRPRWREHLSYEFVRRIWVALGVDDLLNAERRDYFLGAQLRFNDEDLKSILPFAPVRP